MAYQPANARVGGASPQTDPQLFTDDEILAEIKYLLRLNRKYRNHLRTLAILSLENVLASR